MRGPLFMTFACDEGESLQEDRDFTNDLLQYLMSDSQANLGKVNLNKALFELPASVGYNSSLGALKTVTLKSTKFFDGQFAKMADFRQL